MNGNVTIDKIETQADAILYFLQRLDIDMVDDILDNNRTYQDFEKPLFIHKLGNAFNKFLEAGDTFLNCYSGFCNSKLCNYRCRGFSFIGNNSNFYMDLIIDVKDGIVHDMYECSDFKQLESIIKKSKRIRIDNSYLQF